MSGYHPARLFEAGNQDLAGLLFLVDLARFLGCSRIFEIGTYNGVTALALAENLPHAVIDTLDLPGGTRPLLEVSDADEPHLRDTPWRAYEGTQVESRIHQHYGDSAAFDFSPFRDQIDLVYVDGAHSQAYVERDTATAFELASRRSAVVWDDYWWIVRSVAAVLDRLTDRTILRVPETRLAVWLSDEVTTLLADLSSEAT